MRILFLHQNFPGQFTNLAPALATDPRNEVAAFSLRDGLAATWRGVKIMRYGYTRVSTPGIHPWALEMETKLIRGEAVFHACRKLAASGYEPDVIIAHPGWGEALFVKDVWPRVALGIYCEYFYQMTGADIGFDPEFPNPLTEHPGFVRMKNAPTVLQFETADAALCPTRWQASTFPSRFREHMTVVHDGVDTDAVAPNANATVTVPTKNGERTFRRGDEVITFINRNFEPCRGYHQFLRALPEIQRRNPHAHAVLVGNEGKGYNAPPPGGGTWTQVFLDEVRGRLDMNRVHFTGLLPYPTLTALLQVSAVHVYLTYPFVLSWSLIDATSAGAAIVASDTAPVRELIEPGRTGELVDFFAPGQLAEVVSKLLADPARRHVLGAAAREQARTNYDLRRICLPRQIEWVHQLTQRRAASGEITGRR